MYVTILLDDGTFSNMDITNSSKMLNTASTTEVPFNEFIPIPRYLV